MAIYSLNAKIVSRGKGQSLVAQTAYICRSTMVDMRTGVTHSYGLKDVNSMPQELKVLDAANSSEKKETDLAGSVLEKEQVFVKVMLPESAPEAWQDPETLANAVELFEDEVADKRYRTNQKDPIKAEKSALAKEQFLNSAQTAQSLIVALRKGVSLEQQKESLETFVKEVFVDRGLVAITAMHIDDHNPHAHIKVSRRAVIDGKFAEDKDRDIVSKEGLTMIRSKWAEIDNAVARSYGDFEVIDHRSYKERGVNLEPTAHRGWYSEYMERVGKASRIIEENKLTIFNNVKKSMLNPKLLLESLMGEESLFTRAQLVRNFHAKFERDSEFRQLHCKLMGEKLETLHVSDVQSLSDFWADKCLKSSELEKAGFAYNGIQLYSLKGTKENEKAFSIQIQKLSAKRNYGKFFQREILPEAIDRQISKFNKSSKFDLTEEQVKAIHHLCGRGGSLRLVNGAAGTGKTSSLAQVVQLYKDHGYRVFGGSFQASAVQVMKKDLGCECKTLHRFEYEWQKGLSKLSKKDVLIIDEANMVSSEQYRNIFNEVDKRGATLILVGDTNQILSRGKVDIFRTAKAFVGSSDLKQVVRQKVDWMREASSHFASHDLERGLSLYAQHGHLHFYKTEAEFLRGVANYYIESLDSGTPFRELMTTAHKNSTVSHLNHAIREALIESGKLKTEVNFKHKTTQKPFAVGDRIIFTKNDNAGKAVRTTSFFDQERGVKNNDQGQILEVNKLTKTVKVKLDNERIVKFNARSYTHYAHGYAKTVNKAEGHTVDRNNTVFDGFSSANKSYVGLTRHREDMQIHVHPDYAKDFNNLIFKAGRSEVKYSTLDHDRIPQTHHKAVGKYLEQKERLSEAYFSDVQTETHIKEIESDRAQIAKLLLKHWDRVEPLCLMKGIRRTHLEVAANLREKFEHLEPIDRQRAALIEHFASARTGLEKINTAYQLQKSLLSEDINRPTYIQLKKHQIGQKDLYFAVSLFEDRSFPLKQKGEIYQAYLGYQKSAREFAKRIQYPSSQLRHELLDQFDEVLKIVGEARGIHLSLHDFASFESDEERKSFQPNKLSLSQLQDIGKDILSECHQEIPKDLAASCNAMLASSEWSKELSQLYRNRLKAATRFEALMDKEKLLLHFGEQFGSKILKDVEKQKIDREIKAFEQAKSSDEKQHHSRNIEESKEKQLNRSLKPRSERAHQSIDLDDLKSRMNHSAKEIAMHLLGTPNQKLSNAYQLRFGEKGEIAVTIAGSKAGMWYDFESSEGGHLFNLAMREQGWSFKEALTHLSDELGLNHQIERSQKPQEKLVQTEAEISVKKQLKVNKILKGCKDIKGSVAETYLKKRGIETKDLGKDLRFHPGITDYGTKKKHPALVCIAKNLDGEVKAVQVIHLNDKGEKAEVDVVKRSQGLLKGSFVTIQEGTGKKLYLAEGPETAASIANARKDATVLACLGISNFRNLPAKYKAHEIVLCADHDDPIKKSQAVQQVQKALDHLNEKGFKVSVVKPEKEGHDFNDVLKEKGIKALDTQLKQTQSQLTIAHHQQIQDRGLRR